MNRETRESAGEAGYEIKASQEEEFDYYEVFELSPAARPDTVHSVYRILARRYHPDNADTGDEATFRRLVQAYRVLSDPERRAAYDVHWHANRKLQWRIFDHADASTKVAVEKRKRQGILALLYTKRVNAPEQPTLTITEMAELLGSAREHLEVSLWYLQKKGWVERTDNGRYSITVDGFDEAEARGTWQVPKDRLLTDGGREPEPRPAAARPKAPNDPANEALRDFVRRYRI
jgi:curved DNA-binding protein CbpA